MQCKEMINSQSWYRFPAALYEVRDQREVVLEGAHSLRIHDSDWKIAWSASLFPRRPRDHFKQPIDGSAQPKRKTWHGHLNDTVAESSKRTHHPQTHPGFGQRGLSLQAERQRVGEISGTDDDATTPCPLAGSRPHTGAKGPGSKEIESKQQTPSKVGRCRRQIYTPTQSTTPNTYWN